MENNIEFYKLIAQIIPIIILSLVIDSQFTKPSKLEDSYSKLITVAPQLVTLLILFLAEFVSLKAIWYGKSQANDIYLINISLIFSAVLFVYLTYKRLTLDSSNSGMIIFFLLTGIVILLIILFPSNFYMF